LLSKNFNILHNNFTILLINNPICVNIIYLEESMNIKVEDKGTLVIIKPEGRLDAITSEQFQSDSVAKVNDGVSIIIDFSGVDYMSSAGLRSILFIGKKVASTGGKYAVACMTGAVEEVFNMSGFGGMIASFETVEFAEESL